MKRALLLMMQPPGGTGVQGLRYAKLLPHIDPRRWELHFAGPSPQLSCVGLEDPVVPPSQRHYSDSISASTRFSIRKHRYPRRSVRFFVYAALQLLARRLERWSGHDAFSFLRSDLLTLCTAADRRLDFDLIAAKTPDFRMLELGAELARRQGKPFLAIYDDPHGHRDHQGFHPADRDRQIAALQQADGVLFMSPMTRDRYIACGLVDPARTHVLTDSFPLEPAYYRAEQRSEQRSDRHSADDPAAASAAVSQGRPLRLVHLGNLPEWRPIDTLLEALRQLDGGSHGGWQLENYGYLYPEARQLIAADPLLRSHIHVRAAVDHRQSHRVAADSDILVVMIGSRHLDNQPSKFFVYLGHDKPVLVLGPPGNPIQAILEELRIGVFCDVNSSQAISEAIQSLCSHYADYRAAFGSQRSAIARYRADAVAADLEAVLNATLDHAAAAKANPSGGGIAMARQQDPPA